MASIVELRYNRVDKEHYAGELFLLAPKTAHPRAVLDSFEAATFSWMMRRFSERLNVYPEARASMQRTDRAGLPAHVLDDQMTALLRQDPEAAVKAMTVVVHVPPAAAQPVSPLPPVLVVGSNALADSFGERVCCRRRPRPSDQIECPCCGLWVNTTLTQRSVPRPSPTGVGEINAHVPYLAFHCPRGTNLSATPIDERWVSVSVEDLLKLTAPKFFLPRAWNEGRNWITHEALDMKYKSYKQEKTAS